MSQEIPKQQINWYVTTTLVFVHVMAAVSLFMFSWQALAICLVLYVLTAFGITFGFHRLFTHRSFKTNKPIEYMGALLGTLAMQGNILTWVGHHRMHHAFSDTGKDPHNANQSFWHAHMGWLFLRREEMDSKAILNRYARDIVRDPVLRFLGHDLVAAGLQILLGAALWAIWGFEAMMWGIFMRLVLVFHITWLVNSACHKFGYQNYQLKQPELATNCWWVGILALGEGWHNNHHAAQECAYHGHRWWEFDFTGLFIRGLKALGLAWDVKSKPAGSDAGFRQFDPRTPTPAPTPAKV